MRTTLAIAAAALFVIGAVTAQDLQQTNQTQPGAAQSAPQEMKQPQRRHRAAHPVSPAVRGGASSSQGTAVPSIIQSELDRSRAEEKQITRAVALPVRQAAAPTPLWPLILSVIVGALATGGLWVMLSRRRQRSAAPVRQAQPEHRQYAAATAPLPPAPIAARSSYGDSDEFEEELAKGRTVASASPYVYEDDETELPEAALTMNLMNKKRESKKDVILEVMKRVSRKERPQQIAESLRIGIGEVHLAMTLAKLKK